MAEEVHVYPIIEKYVPNGKEEVEHDKKEHDELVDVMKRIEDLDADDPAFLNEVREIHGMLSHHATDEETTSFPSCASTSRARSSSGCARRWRRR